MAGAGFTYAAPAAPRKEFDHKLFTEKADAHAFFVRLVDRGGSSNIL